MKKNWMQNFSKFVRQTRKKLGISQSILAEETGMNTSYISRLEGGDSFQSVKIDFLIKLADSFDMSEHDIIKEVGLR